jgi:hypothetical protein
MTWKLGSYLIEIPVLITKFSQLISFREIITIYSENCVNIIHTLRGHNTEFFHVKTGGALHD